MRNFCEKCGKKVDPQTGFCPDCDAEKLERAAKRREKKPKRIRLGVVILLLLVTACAAYLWGIYDAVIYGDVCQHEWQDATCAVPQTCKLCGETEGEPLEHDWLEATCTMTQRCSVCKSVKGVPLGHTPGKLTETNDFVRAMQHQEQKCTVCESWIRRNDKNMISFSENGMFLFTPVEFMERMKSEAKELYPEFDYEFIEESGGGMAIVSWDGEADSKLYSMSFFKTGSEPIALENIESETVWCVSLGALGKPNDLGELITGDKLDVFASACDPQIDEDIMTMLNMMKYTSFLNMRDFDEPYGYHEQNGLLYEFGHLKFNEEVGLEAVMVYAKNWKWE